MLTTIIIKTRNEVERLRLVLASLSRQTIPVVPPGSRADSTELFAEVVAVDDGSTDGTADFLQSGESPVPVLHVRHVPSRGRSAASNSGAKHASGDLLVFLDGDVLVCPEFAERHAQAHLRSEHHFFGRGEHFNLRCTRFFQDPETGSPRSGVEDQVKRMGKELERNLVTREQVLHDFAAIHRRAQPGIYPGAGPRKLFDVEWDALRTEPGLSVLWMAAAGHNASVRRMDFEAVGGFDERLTINEHRELAYRLQHAGVPVRPVVGACSYHLTHQTGWRDPMLDRSWEQIFYDKHPDPAVKLMSIFWLSLAEDGSIPERLRIPTLAAMEFAARSSLAADYDRLRREHPRLGPLGN